MGALLCFVVVGGMRSGMTGDSAAADTESDAYQRVVERTANDSLCSRHGADRTQDGSAVIRTTAGTRRLVSLQQGWDVYIGKRPGTLVAVCLDDPPPARSRAVPVRPRG